MIELWATCMTTASDLSGNRRCIHIYLVQLTISGYRSLIHLTRTQRSVESALLKDFKKDTSLKFEPIFLLIRNIKPKHISNRHEVYLMGFKIPYDSMCFKNFLQCSCSAIRHLKNVHCFGCSQFRALLWQIYWRHITECFHKVGVWYWEYLNRFRAD
jgi:hypothetical protein